MENGKMGIWRNKVFWQAKLCCKWLWIQDKGKGSEVRCLILLIVRMIFWWWKFNLPQKDMNQNLTHLFKLSLLSPPNHSRCFQFHERRNTMDHYRYWSPVPRHLAAKLQDVDRGKGEVFVWLPGQSTQTWDKCLYLTVLCARVRLFKFRKCDFDNHCWFANCRPGFTHRTSIFLLWSDHHDIVNIPTKSYSLEWSRSILYMNSILHVTQ